MQCLFFLLAFNFASFTALALPTLTEDFGDFDSSYVGRQFCFVSINDPNELNGYRLVPIYLPNIHEPYELQSLDSLTHWAANTKEKPLPCVDNGVAFSGIPAPETASSERTPVNSMASSPPMPSQPDHGKHDLVNLEYLNTVKKRLLEREKWIQGGIKRQRVKEDSFPSLNLRENPLFAMADELDWLNVFRKCYNMTRFNGKEMNLSSLRQVHSLHLQHQLIADISIATKITGTNVKKIIMAVNEQYLNQGLVTPETLYASSWSTSKQFNDTRPFSDTLHDLMNQVESNIKKLPKFGVRGERKYPLTFENIRDIFVRYVETGKEDSIFKDYKIAYSTLKAVLSWVTMRLRTLEDFDLTKPL